MNFILTEYLYELKQKCQLSEQLNIYFDNPRTEKEISTLASYLEYSCSNDPQYSYINNYLQATQKAIKRLDDKDDKNVFEAISKN